jgi:hypothetical protein
MYTLLPYWCHVLAMQLYIHACPQGGESIVHTYSHVCVCRKRTCVMSSIMLTTRDAHVRYIYQVYFELEKEKLH